MYNIVLTGGPCSGKSTVLELVRKKLEEAGYFVITIPETAEEFIKNKIKSKPDYDFILKYQKLILDRQLFKEKQTKDYINYLDEKNVIVLYDRGVFDNLAYLNNENDFDNMLSSCGLNQINLLDSYDLVIDLVSLASLKKELYKTNEIRSEDDQQAKALDKKTLLAWSNHDNLCVVKPTDVIEEKVDIICNLIVNLVHKNQKRVMYDIKEYNNSELADYNIKNSKSLEITDYYISMPNYKKIDYKLSKRTYNNNTSLLLSAIINVSDEKKVLIESRKISDKEFEDFLQESYVSRIDEKTQISYVDDDFNLCKVDMYKNKPKAKCYKYKYL